MNRILVCWQCTLSLTSCLGVLKHKTLLLSFLTYRAVIILPDFSFIFNSIFIGQGGRLYTIMIGGMVVVFRRGGRSKKLERSSLAFLKNIRLCLYQRQRLIVQMAPASGFTDSAGPEYILLTEYIYQIDVEMFMYLNVLNPVLYYCGHLLNSISCRSISNFGWIVKY